MKNIIFESLYIIIKNISDYTTQQSMSITSVYINETLYLSDSTTDITCDGVTRIMGRYFGSSSRINEIGEVYKPDTATPYPDLHIRVVEEIAGVETAIYDGVFNAMEHCIEVVEGQTAHFITFFNNCNSDDKEKMIQSAIERGEESKAKIRAGTSCPLQTMSTMTLTYSRNVTLHFRDLHRFGGAVEIAGVSYTVAE